MPDLDAIGEAVTGGMAGRAVEPHTGQSDGHTQESNCLNCGTSLTGDYCQECGQKAHVHRTLTAFWHDLLHGVLHFEGKIWSTLPLLAWKPGELTRRYIDGERAKFISPMALFLFSVFLMFAVLGLTDNFSVVPQEAMRVEMSEKAAADKTRLADLEAERAKAASIGDPLPVLDRRIANLRADIIMEERIARDGLVTGTVGRIAADLPDPLRGPVEKAANNPEFLFYKMRTNGYKWSWAIIPLSVPFLWLLFPFSRRFRLYDHTIFITYSLCFMTLLACAASVVAALGATVVAQLAVLIPAFHIYRQLRGAYGIGRFAALWRTMFLTTIAIIVLATFAATLLGIGIFD